MQDPRIRLISTVVLSIAAFISVTGAVMAVLWWIVCTNRATSFKSPRMFLLVMMVPAFASGMLWISGENFAGYFIRIASILLIASWAYEDRYPGEFLDVSVWMFGRNIGFDLGLVAEMSISALEVLTDDIRRVKIALAQKNQKLGPKTLAPVLTSLLVRQLNLARERACILAIRGYRGGGSLCPVFTTRRSDIIAGVISMLIFLLAPSAGAFFIALKQIVIV